MAINLKLQKKIYVANDTHGLNNRYRSDLIMLLSTQGNLVSSINLYQLIKLRFFRGIDDLIICNCLWCRFTFWLISEDIKTTYILFFKTQSSINGQH